MESTNEQELRMTNEFSNADLRFWNIGIVGVMTIPLGLPDS